MDETGVKDIYLEQLYTFGSPERDPRARIVTVAYFALIKPRDIGHKKKWDVSDVQWASAYKLPKLAFDHSKIVEYALKRLRWKLEYTTVGFQLLPEKFTLTQVQDIYETILGKKFDKRNFRKKILELGLVKPSREILKDVAHRPARLYTLSKKIGDIIEII